MQEKFNKIFVERQEIIEAITLISKKYFDEFTYLDPDASYSEDVNAFYSAFFLLHRISFKKINK
jgi:hypothetical protein